MSKKQRPIEVTAASVIAPRVRGTPCPLCEGTLRLDDQSATTREGRLLHAAHVTCVSCGVGRALWFRVAPPLPS